MDETRPRMETAPSEPENREKLENVEESTVDEADEANMALLQEQAAIEEDERQLQSEAAAQVQVIREKLMGEYSEAPAENEEQNLENQSEAKETEAELGANREKVRQMTDALGSLVGAGVEYQQNIGYELFNPGIVTSGLEQAESLSLEEYTDENTKDILKKGYDNILMAVDALNDSGLVAENNSGSRDAHVENLRQLASGLFFAENQMRDLLGNNENLAGSDEILNTSARLNNFADQLEGIHV